MRGFLASSIGVTCAAALALPAALPSGALAATAAHPRAGAADTSTGAPAADALPAAPPGAHTLPSADDTPGHTRSLPLPDAPAGRGGPPRPRPGRRLRKPPGGVAVYAD
ncbi:N-acetylmuramoyl-L-alanine amidase, partial [Streptomyces albidoflavus]